MTTSSALLPATVRPTATAVEWPVGNGTAAPVLDLLTALGWAVVATPLGDAHATSPDGRAYLAFLPEDPAAWARGTLWTLQVTPAHGQPWTQEFGHQVPAELVAAFIAALYGPTGN
ncbi:DUF317 domain-containing protein [Streptacidiphilus sp. PB12-B1b]|uniref:DUF317 domain-containing protein n=1 Tax=Streptacidiphilus sp. PB12-B1b TaxID=2705012 RepID=UPI001CDC00B8|nr:DUF317 domain-containing protein [Streptacidiphilus sp. PB12-B1b]